MVDGKTNLTKSQLEAAGIELCARHTEKKETYRGEAACSKPEDVFPDGELPDIMIGDPQALLLVRCPTASYSNGKDMQRVLCSQDYGSDELGNGSSSFDTPTSFEAEELSIRFDDARQSANCETPGQQAKEQAAGDSTTSAGPPVQPGPGSGGGKAEAGLAGGGRAHRVASSGPEEFPKSMFSETRGLKGPLPDPAKHAAAKARRRKSFEQDRQTFQASLKALVRSEAVAHHTSVSDMIADAELASDSAQLG